MSRPGGFDIQSSLGNALGDASLGGVAGTLSGALSDLMRSATAAGSEASRKLDSWVGTGQNLAATGADIRAMVGEDTLNELADRTGLALEELENRLASILPEAVNHLTPEGSIPPEYGSGQSAT